MSISQKTLAHAECDGNFKSHPLKDKIKYSFVHWLKTPIEVKKNQRMKQKDSVGLGDISSKLLIVCGVCNCHYKSFKQQSTIPRATYGFMAGKSTAMATIAEYLITSPNNTTAIFLDFTKPLA